MWRSWLVVLALGCHSKPGEAPDAAPGPDVAEPDAMVDMAIDAAIEIDATPDAAPINPCAQPSSLLDVSPRRLGNMVRVGQTLYTNAYAFDGATISDSTLISIDLTTVSEAAAPVALAH